MIKTTIAMGAMLLTVLTPVIAMAGGSPIGSFNGLTFKVGSLGFGVEAIKPINKNINARIGVNYLSLSRSKTYRGVGYDVDIDLQSLSLLADWSPKGNNFFLTSGLMLNGNKAKAHGTKTGTVKIGDNSFSGTANYDTDVKFNKIAPYFGSGFKKQLKNKKMFFVAEVGVLFHGDPEVTVDVEVPTSSGITQADVDKERQKIQDDMGFIKVLPVVSVGVVYQF